MSVDEKITAIVEEAPWAHRKAYATEQYYLGHLRAALARVGALEAALREALTHLQDNADRNRFNAIDDPDWTGVGEAQEVLKKAVEPAP